MTPSMKGGCTWIVERPLTTTKDLVSYKNTCLLYVLVALLGSLHRIIMQELLNEVHMGKNHASAAISFKLKFIESVPFTHVFCEELKVRIPFVADDFSAGETAHRNDHLPVGPSAWHPVT